MWFTELKELISIVGHKNISDAHALGVSKLDKEDPWYRLYNGVRTDRFESQEMASRELFNSGPGDNAFKLLKSRLKQQLIDVIVGHNVSKDKGISAQQRAVYESVKGVYEVRALMNAGALNVARSQAERLLNTAMKHDVTEPAMQLARMLRSMSVYLGDRKKAEQYAETHHSYTARFHAENRSEEIVDEIFLHFSVTTDDQAVEAEEFDSVCLEVERLRREYPTFLVTTNYFRVQCLQSHMKRDYLRAARFGLEAIGYLEEHPELVSRNRIAEFATIVMNEYATLGDFVQAEHLAARCFENYQPQSNQWYNFLSLYFVLTMHSGDYKKAMGLFRKAAVTALTLQPKANQERWKLYAGYLLYLHEAGFADFNRSELDLIKKNFDRLKFSFAFNYDLEVYAKDKTGMRLSVLILEFLFALEHADVDDILSKQEKLRLLYYRVLKADVYPRANAFFHLLQILMQEDFDADRAERRGYEDMALLDPHVVQLNKSKSQRTIRAVVSMEGLEILRYERLWSMILQRVRAGTLRR